MIWVGVNQVISVLIWNDSDKNHVNLFYNESPYESVSGRNQFFSPPLVGKARKYLASYVSNQFHNEHHYTNQIHKIWI